VYQDGLCSDSTTSAGGLASSAFPAGDDGLVTAPVLSEFVVELTVSSCGDDIYAQAGATSANATRAEVNRGLRCF